MVSNTESNASESDSSQAKAKKKKTDNYPIQFKLMYRTSDKLEEPRAVKRIWEDMILINKLQWTLASSVKKKERREEDSGEDGSLVKDLFTEEDAERLMKLYYMLPEETVYYCILFRRALLVNPSFGSTHGRLAFQNICIMLCKLLPLPYKHRCLPVNGGGSAPTLGSNCQIGYNSEEQDSNAIAAASIEFANAATRFK